ncbi:hypothetical protein Dimus_020170 [Dionaea muscipula]
MGASRRAATTEGETGPAHRGDYRACRRWPEPGEHKGGRRVAADGLAVVIGRALGYLNRLLPQFSGRELEEKGEQSSKRPLDDKEGEEPVKTDFYEETFLNLCQLKREQGVLWLRFGANRRRDNKEEVK